MSFATLFGFRRRDAAPRETLSPLQTRCLGALLLAAQLPQALHLPIWVAVTESATAEHVCQKLKTSGRALPEVSEVYHKVECVSLRLRGRQSIWRLPGRK